MSLFKSISITIILLLLYVGCTDKNTEPKGAPEYIAEVQQWNQKRIERLKEDNGWLNLVGLFWLEEGTNSFGSSKENDIRFPENSPAKIGVFFLKDSITSVKINEGIVVTENGNPIKEMYLKADVTGDPTILDLGSLRWYIIQRGDKFGIRLRDLEAPLVKDFEDIDMFPINDDWKIEAKFEVYTPPKIISLPTQIGTIAEEEATGAVVFEKEGVLHRIDAIDTGKRLWLIFADETNGEKTYGAGRYLYIDKPDSTGKLFVDFNYAYNPPCVFTRYATCSFPPKQNYLRLRVTSGEKMWGGNH